MRQIVGDELMIHIDLAERDYARLHPADFYADEHEAIRADAAFSQLVSPLVIEPDGTTVPLQHGFARRYALGNLHDAPLRQLMDCWRATRHEEFRRLCREVFRGVIDDSRPPVFNWYEMVGQAGSLTRLRLRRET